MQNYLLLPEANTSTVTVLILFTLLFVKFTITFSKQSSYRRARVIDSWLEWLPMYPTSAAPNLKNSEPDPLLH